MGLSGAQKNAISSSWKTISTDCKNNGALLFELLFKSYPDARDQHFPHFAGLGDGVMKNSGVGRAHAMAVLTGIGAFVNCLEDAECLEGLALKLARNHVDRNIGPARFQQMRQVFGPFLDQVLGGGASADVKGAWDAFLGWLQDSLAAEEKKR